MPASTRSNGTFSSSSPHNTFCTLMELARPQTLSIVISRAPFALPVYNLDPRITATRSKAKLVSRPTLFPDQAPGHAPSSPKVELAELFNVRPSRRGG